jgi:hypothetical protein
MLSRLIQWTESLSVALIEYEYRAADYEYEKQHEQCDAHGATDYAFSHVESPSAFLAAAQITIRCIGNAMCDDPKPGRITAFAVALVLFIAGCSKPPHFVGQSEWIF